MMRPATTELSRSAALAVAAGARVLRSLVAFVAVLLAVAWPAKARAAEAVTGVERREILALYDGSRQPSPDTTLLHRLAQMPLNHLGYVVRYRDVRDGLPDAAGMWRYRAVLTWFEAPLADASSYLDWASRVACSGTRFVVMGEIGGDPFSPDLRAVNRLMSCIGLQHGGQMAAVTLGSEATVEDAGMVGFEIGLDPVLPPFPIVAVKGPGVRSALSVRPPPSGRLQRSTLIATGRGGGYAASGYIYRYEAAADRTKWIIDPFAFFARALSRGPMPVPDVTTVSGRRLYFSHVDGDGWNDIVETAGYRDRRVIAAEVLEKELIAPFPSLPVSVGLVAGDVADARQQDAREAARRIFALPQVEVASHTYSSPRTWASSSDGDGAGGIGQWAGKAWRALGGGAGADPPDLAVEVDRAVSVTKALAPEGKPVALYTWSGDNRPSAAAIKATRALGLRNLNGGGARLDVGHASLAYVPPSSRDVDGERQIYAAGYDEHAYSFAAHPTYTFQSLARTIEATERPRRLTAINLHYTAHAAARTATTASLKRYLSTFAAMPLAPVSASEYAAIADSFDGVELVRAGAQRWIVRNRGAIQTLRVDDADDWRIDWNLSDGVIGETRHNGALYIALDAAVAEPAVALSGGAAADAATRPVLFDSRWRVSAVSAEPCRLRFKAQGYGEGAFYWSGVEPGRHRISVTRAGDTLLETTVEATPQGRLQFAVPAAGHESVDVAVTCVPARGS